MAAAQACCAGAGAFAPARLKLWEQALVGVQLKAVDSFGSFDPNGHYVNNPAGDSEVDLEEDVLAGYRINEHAQIGIVIPFVETSRTEGGLSEFGGGLGDITVHARYDIILPGNGNDLPGVAVVGGITTPTGRSPSQAKTPLAVDATGTGYWQGAAGISLYRTLGSWFASIGAALWGAIPQTVGNIHEAFGPQVTGLLALGYSFHNGAALAGTLAYNNLIDEWTNGQREPGVSYATFGVALGWPIAFNWRIQAAVSDILPILGVNHVAGIGATWTVLRTF